MIKDTVAKAEELRLKTIGENLAQAIEIAARKNWSCLQAIDHLFALELENRKQGRIASRFKQSKLTEKLTIDQFDFDHHSSRKKQKTTILNLMALEFLEHRMDIILIGNPGVGKSFLAKAIAYAATQAGTKVLFTTAMDMINHLIAAEADHSLLKKLHYYQSPDLLAIDEIGYLALGTQGSNCSSRLSVSGMKKNQRLLQPISYAVHRITNLMQSPSLCGEEIFTIRR